MNRKNSNNKIIGLFLLIAMVLIISFIFSCGKQNNASPAGTNVQYHVLNLSPDLFPVNLFIEFKQANSSPYVFNVDQGYFYVPSVVLPYQFRTALVAGTELFERSDSLKAGLKYTLFIVGNQGNASVKQIFTVDTASLPAVGRGKLRFVNASPTGTGGLDVFANGTQAFNNVLYTNYSKFIELPAGNYDIQINATGSSNVLKELNPVTIQDGRIYTMYAYGYSNRVDTAAFNAAVITNR
ncbi:MAG TPA: DUF4397 domain-containing protein [Mucilaginibacter sp.]|jgi:hypothetical protein